MLSSPLRGQDVIVCLIPCQRLTQQCCTLIFPVDTGAILTKMDGDSRGGAALSMKAVSGRPVKFISTGERLEQLEAFYPDRVASRILGELLESA